MEHAPCTLGMPTLQLQALVHVKAAWPEARAQSVSLPAKHKSHNAESCSYTECLSSNRKVLNIGASVPGP